MLKKLNPVLILASVLLLTGCTNKKEVSNPTEPDDPEFSDTSVWKNIQSGVQSGFGSIDIAYKKSYPPSDPVSQGIEINAWRGEKISCQLLIWSSSEAGEITIKTNGLFSEDGTIGSENIEIRTVKYVLSDEFMTGCGYRDKDTIPSYISPDLLDETNKFTLQSMETRPVWISISVPHNSKPGYYKGELLRISQYDTIKHPVSLEVLDKKLPPPSGWEFHLDLWQNPFAVARYHDVELWSQEHIDLLRPLLLLLADAGQKCITTTLNDRPWGGQTYDPFGAMINWIRNSNGQWEYDYSIFDQYVNLAMECGINKQINCYSMVPWGNRFSWFDEDSARYVTITAIPGTTEYEEIWKPFLNDFKVHLMERGWLDITTLALDERSQDEMEKMFRFLDNSAPDFKIAMAGHYFEEINSKIFDFSYNWRHISEESRDVAQKRGGQNKKTTYYVACGIPMPNNFTFSPPSESCYEGWFAAAMGFDGFLRWAYNSWVEDPVMDSRFRTWPSGDTYFVYPGARSSVRFERLREGIQDYEKINILIRELALNPSDEAAAAEVRINRFLNSIDIETLNNRSAAEVINEGKQMIYEISILPIPKPISDSSDPLKP